MEKYIIIIITTLFLMTSCVTCPPCPPQDSYVFHPNTGPILIPKGLLDKREAWKTEEELKEWFQEGIEKQRDRKQQNEKQQDRKQVVN